MNGEIERKEWWVEWCLCTSTVKFSRRRQKRSDNDRIASVFILSEEIKLHVSRIIVESSQLRNLEKFLADMINFFPDCAKNSYSQFLNNLSCCINSRFFPNFLSDVEIPRRISRGR